MSNELLIRFIEGEKQEDLYYSKSSPVVTSNGIMSFRGFPIIPLAKGETVPERDIVIHISNIAFFRELKETCGSDTNKDFIVHYKNNNLVEEMMKGEHYPSGDYLVVDTDYYATFIPLKNIRYYEVF